MTYEYTIKTKKGDLVLHLEGLGVAPSEPEIGRALTRWVQDTESCLLLYKMARKRKPANISDALKIVKAESARLFFKYNTLAREDEELMKDLSDEELLQGLLG